METTTAARPEAASIETVVSEALSRRAKGEPVEAQAQQIWGLLYEQVPNLDYSTTAGTIGNGSVKGNPDVIKALSECLVSAGLPDTPETHRLAMPVFWVLSAKNALEPQQTAKNAYLWSLDIGNHRAAKEAYDLAFEEHKPYIVCNLESALGQKLNEQKL